MQSLDIITVNLWQIVISLINLLLLFLIVKKLLFKPVQKVLADRQAALDARYAEAERDRKLAQDMKFEWDGRMANVQADADELMKRANANAEARGKAIVEAANGKAGEILRRAEADAELERERAQEGIRSQIVDVSAVLAGKLLEREVSAEDHRRLIDDFLSEAGED